ncbi:MAG: hypothetical protein IKA76_08205 [Clostridia bacterium]|nr:hypothetical protein [Clostridia bacterium]
MEKLKNQRRGDRHRFIKGLTEIHPSALKICGGAGKEKPHNCWEEYVSLAEAAIFEYAFRLGARLTMEAQTDINK